MTNLDSHNRKSETAYILFGSNLGDRPAQISEAINRIIEQAGQLISLSSVYETEPWGFRHETSFLNQAMGLLTHKSPGELLQILLSVEKVMGRVRKGGGYHARNIDIDILLYGLDIICQSDLIVPHPRLCERRFTLVPLEEIAPLVRHPLINKSIRELLAACKDQSWVRKLP
jgi:2-amino-4-hydroxy-6-hydroxymethyldihydropteridine diphosphokinase